MKNIVVVLSIYLIMVGCQSNTINNTKLEYLEIEVNNFISEMDLSNYYDAEFIPLELTQEALIGVINKVIIYKQHIYVLDKEKAKKLFKFDIKGKYISTIGKLGKGEGEYIVLTDFDIKEDLIYLSSQQNNKMLIFDLEGNHIKDIKFSDYIGMGFKVLDDNSFIVKNSDGSNKSAIFYNNKGKVVKTISCPEFTFLRFSNPQIFSEFMNEDYMFFAMNDTVYQIESDSKELTPKIVVDFGERRFPLSEIKDKQGLLKKYENEEYLHLENFFTSDRFHFLEIYNSKYPFKVIVNKRSNKVSYANTVTYKGLSIGYFIGSTKMGPLFIWEPSTIPLYKKRFNKVFDFLPAGCLNATINENPGIAILSEKMGK